MTKTISPQKVCVTETILRDAHQCLIATRMRTEDMLGICGLLDKIGFWSLEVWGGATFDACLRYLKEDPWQRLKQLRKALPNTQLQMLLRGQNLLGYRHYPDDVVKVFVERAVENGIDVFRIFDALNDVRNIQSSVNAVKELGAHAQGTICYTTSPVHTVKKFVALGKKLENLGCDSIVIKDMAGLLTPSVTAELVRRLVKRVSIPIQIHSHATSGLAGLCQLKAVENGCFHIDTAISAFAEGASHPCTETMVAAFKETPYDTGLDLNQLIEVGEYFRHVRKKYHQFESESTRTDCRVQINQVPGGMISNLYNQLKEQNALNKLPDVLKEIPAVREDLGYPPLVTPTSQIVGTQALLNVLSGVRYKNITNEVKLYLQGRYGKAPAVVNEQIKQQAIGNEFAIDCRPADLLKNEMPRFTKEIGEWAESVDDVLIFAMFPDIGREFLQQRKAGTLKPEILLPLPTAAAASPVLTQQSENKTKVPNEFRVTLHGEAYDVRITGCGTKLQSKRPFYVTVDGVPEEIILETAGESVIVSQSEAVAVSEEVVSIKRPKATLPGHVTASMPGKVVACLVKQGDQVKAGQPLMVIEAMKMETEIQAPLAGQVAAVYVVQGDLVTPDDALIEVKP